MADERVLHFRVGSEEYCLSIHDIEEVVERGDLSVLPKSPDHVLGVQDLRDSAVEVVDPKIAFGIDGDYDDGNYVMVMDEEFERKDRLVAWVIDEVFEVLRVDEDDVDDSLYEDEGVKGGIRNEDDDLIIWLEPEDLFEANVDY